MITVRTYKDADRAALIDLFGRAGENSPSGELWGHAASERAVYLDPYMEHCPDTLLLAEREGVLVGYLTGCPDPSLFPSEEELLRRAFSLRVVVRPATLRFLTRGVRDAIRSRGQQGSPGALEDPRWPAHAHINVVPQARGAGAGAALIASWLEHLDATGTGSHLQTLVENEHAARFFGRWGFAAHGPTPLVPAVRHEGRPVHQLTMVRPAPPF